MAVGHASTPPPKSVMNSRRFNRSNCMAILARVGKLPDTDFPEISQRVAQLFPQFSQVRT
jgi:hypothetical protein